MARIEENSHSSGWPVPDGLVPERTGNPGHIIRKESIRACNTGLSKILISFGSLYLH